MDNLLNMVTQKAKTDEQRSLMFRDMAERQMKRDSQDYHFIMSAMEEDPDFLAKQQSILDTIKTEMHQMQILKNKKMMEDSRKLRESITSVPKLQDLSDVTSPEPASSCVGTPLRDISYEMASREPTPTPVQDLSLLTDDTQSTLVTKRTTPNSNGASFTKNLTGTCNE